MARPDRIEGLAIVSADGMIADADGIQPPSLRQEADQRFFHSHLEQATAVAHGRNSAEGGPQMATRRRLILTNRIAAFAPDPANKNALHWNPDGATLDEAWERLGLSGGMLVVIGGTGPFGLFLDSYDCFHLTRAERALLPGGRPVFPGIPPASPEQLLAKHGLHPGAPRILDDKAALSLVTWSRR